MKKQFLLAGLVLGASVAFGATAHANTDIYRLYNPNTGEHFYTAAAAEKNALASGGWNYEGTGWVAPNSGKAVYRVYNPNAVGGDHYYTESKGEAEVLVKLGWHWDNNAKPVFYAGGKTKVYVAYNPNAKSGSHNYTTAAAEQNSLLKVGWKFGATAWMAEGPGKAIAMITGQQSAPRAVDKNIVTAGGHAGSNPGSYRNLYAYKAFDASPTGTPTVSLSADVAMSGSSDGSEVQFVLAGTSNGQIGIELHNNASGVNQMPYWKAGINAATINFAANAGVTGQQFYSSVPSLATIGQGQSVHLEINYYASGAMQTKVNGIIIGQYKTSLTGVASAQYVVHATKTNAAASISNLKVLKNGKVEGPINGTNVSAVTGAGVLY